MLKFLDSKYRRHTAWSDTVVSTMRSGLISRLNDLRLVKREKHGKYITYNITDAGKKYLQSSSEKDSLTIN